MLQRARVTMISVVIAALLLQIGDSVADGDDEMTTQLEMVGHLEAHNKPPSLVKHAAFPLRGLGASSLPLFPLDFDWNDQDRVKKYVISLGATESVETWDGLIAHIGNETYCITIQQDLGDPVNYSVGMMCERIARQRLNGVFMDDLGLDDRGLPVRILTSGNRMRDLKEWRKKHSSLNFAEMQVEVGKLLLAKTADIPHIQEERRLEIRENIGKLVHGIETSKKPRFVPFWKDSFRVYCEKDSKQIRKALMGE